jgi:cysteine synthase
MWAAIEQAKRLEQGTVVVLLPDSGSRYLSTRLFDFAHDPQVQG